MTQPVPRGCAHRRLLLHAAASWLGSTWLPQASAQTYRQMPAPSQVPGSQETFSLGGTWRILQSDVYVLEGVNQDISLRNAGQVVHTGIIATPQGAVVIDPGPTHRWGRWVAAQVRSQLGLSVRWVINTHAHPENVLGNSAFAGLPIYAGALTRQLMQVRCVQCLRRLRQTIGRRAMRGTHIILPNQVLREGEVLVLGGRRLQIQIFRQAHSQGDTTVWDETSGTLFAGGLAYRERLPELQEAAIDDWLAALQACARWPIQHVVSAGVGTPWQTLVPTQAYLSSLRAEVWRRLQAGEDGATASQTLQLSDFQTWQGYTSRHAQNVQRAWLQLEQRWMAG